MTRPFRMKLATKVVHNIKDISNITINYHYVYYLSSGCSHGNHRQKSVSGWLVLQNSWADIFHRWDVDSTQLELSRSVIE